MIRTLKTAAPGIAGLVLVLESIPAHEGIGRAGLRELEGVEVESEIYTGNRGYLHGGIGLIAPLGEGRRIGLTAHAVQEETGGSTFPSVGAEFIQKLGHGFEVEAFSFGYLPVEKQNAWAAGVRVNRHFAIDDGVSISPFFGPAYARVTALDEASAQPVDISHLMLTGGVAIEGGNFALSVFASHSFFSRNPVGLETHVDLEEMTHFAAYENNDGFARNTAGAEVSWSLTQRIELTGRYALILYEGETRHSFSVTPSFKFGHTMRIFTGFQLLRGDGPHNDLFTAGVAISF